MIEQSNKLCEECGAEMVYTGEQVKYKIEYIPAKVKLIEYHIKQYQCPECNCQTEEKINIFDNESFLTPSMASFIVNNKYNYALPLYRQEAMLTQLGAPITRQSLANYCIKIAEALEPIYDLLKKKLISTEVKILHADETTYRILEHTERQKCYIWLYATSFYEAPIYIYEYQKTRAEEHQNYF